MNKTVRINNPEYAATHTGWPIGAPILIRHELSRETWIESFSRPDEGYWETYLCWWPAGSFAQERGKWGL